MKSGSLYDLIEDTVRGGGSVANGRWFADLSSVQDDKMLCPACTREFDNKNDEYTLSIGGQQDDRLDQGFYRHPA
jgi:hypothetical protein